MPHFSQGLRFGEPGYSVVADHFIKLSEPSSHGNSSSLEDVLLACKMQRLQACVLTRPGSSLGLILTLAHGYSCKGTKWSEGQDTCLSPGTSLLGQLRSSGHQLEGQLSSPPPILAALHSLQRKLLHSQECN